MPHLVQKKCLAVPVLNRYVPNASAPERTATAPRIRQYEHVQRRAVCNPFVSRTRKRTVPQWQAPSSVEIFISIAPHLRSPESLKVTGSIPVASTTLRSDSAVRFRGSGCELARQTSKSVQAKIAS